MSTSIKSQLATSVDAHVASSNHASDVLYPAIKRAMEVLEEITLPGVSPDIDKLYNGLHAAFWSETPAPASAPALRPIAGENPVVIVGATGIDLAAIFESFSDDYLKFEDMDQPMHTHPDVSAMLLLESLVPAPFGRMIASARHDEVFLATDCDQLSKVITVEQVRDLVRCGIRLDEDALCMFV